MKHNKRSEAKREQTKRMLEKALQNPLKIIFKEKNSDS